LLSLQRLIDIALAVIRVKVSAVFLEPTGVGIVSQVGGFQNLMSQFVNLGVGGGVTKYVAEYTSKQESRSLEKLLQTVVSGFAITGIIAFLISLIFAPQFADLALADHSLGLLIVLAGIAVPLTAQTQIVSRCLQGMLKIREMVLLGMVSSVLGLVITVPLIILANVTGAVLSMGLSALFSLAIGQLYLQRVALREYHVRLHFAVPDKEMSIKLLRFGGANSVMVISDILTLLAIRSTIIARFGAASNGLYQVVFGLSNQYLALITAALWTYGMPKVATMLDDPAGIDKVRNDVLRLSLSIFTPLIVLILVFRGVWIPILYSQSFIGASSLLGWQVIGDIFRAIFGPANISNAPKERFGFIIGQTLLFSMLQLGTFWLLLPLVGLRAAPMSYALARGVMTPIVLFAHYRYDRFVYSSKNWLLVVKSIPVLGVTLILTSLPNVNPVLNYLVPSVALVAWALTVVSHKEVQTAVRIGHDYVARFQTAVEVVTKRRKKEI